MMMNSMIQTIVLFIIEYSYKTILDILHVFTLLHLTKKKLFYPFDANAILRHIQMGFITYL